jgi:hypothetical protein
MNTHKAMSFFVHTEKALFDMLEMKEEQQRTREKNVLLESGSAVFTEEDRQKERSRMLESERRKEEERQKTKELSQRISNRIKKMSEKDMVEAYRASLNRLNLGYFKEYDDDIANIVTNVCNLVKYERVDPWGPKRGRITTGSALIYPYFSHVKAIGFENVDYLSTLHGMSLDRPHVYGQENVAPALPVPDTSVMSSDVEVESDFLGLPAVSNGMLWRCV